MSTVARHAWLDEMMSPTTAKSRMMEAAPELERRPILRMRDAANTDSAASSCTGRAVLAQVKTPRRGNCVFSHNSRIVGKAFPE